MDLTSLARHQRTAGRLAQILTILCKYSLADWLKAVNVRLVRKFLTSFDGQPIAGLPTEVRIRMALTEMGTTFIKLGQILSTRPDLVGPALADELSSLLDDTPADPPQTVRTLIETELHKPIEELFAEFGAAAFASASIGQVHLARLHDGRQVVVKVLHHNIEDKVFRDLDIMMALADLGEKYSTELRHYRPRATTGEFRRTLLRELDFHRELRNIQEFIHNFAGDKTVRFPTPHPTLSIAPRADARLPRRHRYRRHSASSKQGARSARHRARLGRLPPHDLPRWLLSRRSAPRQFARAARNHSRRARLRHGGPHRRTHPRAFTTMLLSALGKDSGRFTDVVTRLAAVPPDLDRDAFESEVHDSSPTTARNRSTTSMSAAPSSASPTSSAAITCCCRPISRCSSKR